MANKLNRSSSGFWAAAGGMLLGVLLAALGVVLLVDAKTPTVLAIAVFVLAAVEIACGYFTIARNRMAWAFLISTNSTATVIAFFVSPRVSDAAGISVELATLPAFLFLCIAGMAVASGDFSAQADDD